MCAVDAIPPQLSGDADALANSTQALQGALGLALGHSSSTVISITGVACVQRAGAAPGVSDVSISFSLSAEGAGGEATAALIARLDANLPHALANMTGEAAVITQSSAQRISTCGNGLCEAGESPSTCPFDCTVTLQSCDYALPLSAPRGSTPLLCAGRGSCRVSDGSCLCHAGYAAPSCSACGVGYTQTRFNGSTVPATGSTCSSIEAGAIAIGGASFAPIVSSSSSLSGLLAALGERGFTAFVVLLTAAIVAARAWWGLLEGTRP